MSAATSIAEDPLRTDQPGYSPYSRDTALNVSAVSWGAILAGAAGAAALALILLILGMGLGFSSVSPWSNHGVSAATIGWATILWLTFTQLAASGMGGYLAGRLRTKWMAVHTDEVYFRDTAHGFLAWAVATLVTAVLLTSTISAIVSEGAQGSAKVAGGAAMAGATALAAKTDKASPSDSMGYFVDSLFRKDMTAPTGAAQAKSDDANTANSTPEVARIFINDVRMGNLPEDDMHYVGQLVAQRTGMSQADAENRVTNTFNKIQEKIKATEATAREAADKARKASAYAALWLFVSLLIGAFVASLAATYGGRRRDL